MRSMEVLAKKRKVKKIAFITVPILVAVIVVLAIVIPHLLRNDGGKPLEGNYFISRIDAHGLTIRVDDFEPNGELKNGINNEKVNEIIESLDEEQWRVFKEDFGLPPGLSEEQQVHILKTGIMETIESYAPFFSATPFITIIKNDDSFKDSEGNIVQILESGTDIHLLEDVSHIEDTIAIPFYEFVWNKQKGTLIFDEFLFLDITLNITLVKR